MTWRADITTLHSLRATDHTSLFCQYHLLGAVTVTLHHMDVKDNTSSLCGRIYFSEWILSRIKAPGLVMTSTRKGDTVFKMLIRHCFVVSLISVVCFAQLSSVPWPIGSSSGGGLGGWFCRDPFLFCCRMLKLCYICLFYLLLWSARNPLGLSWEEQFFALYIKLGSQVNRLKFVMPLSSQCIYDDVFFGDVFSFTGDSFAVFGLCLLNQWVCLSPFFFLVVLMQIFHGCFFFF